MRLYLVQQFLALLERCAALVGRQQQACQHFVPAMVIICSKIFKILKWSPHEGEKLNPPNPLAVEDLGRQITPGDQFTFFRINQPCPRSTSASERRGNTLQGLRDFHLKARAGIWP